MYQFTQDIIKVAAGSIVRQLERVIDVTFSSTAILVIDPNAIMRFLHLTADHKDAALRLLCDYNILDEQVRVCTAHELLHFIVLP